MSVAKVTLNGNVIVDMTDATAAASDITAPKTAYIADGSKAIGSGGGSDDSKTIIFIDYDGTELYKYTPQEFLALSALPANPSHTGLTAQGWNWSLSDAKAYVTAYPNADLIIGQSYITSDGKTRLYITVEDIFDVSIPSHLKFTASVDGGVAIDWGDNSAVEYSTGTDVTLYSHTYSVAGDYVITLTVLSGNISLSTYLIGASADINANVERRRVRKIEVGSSVSNFNGYCFAFNYLMETITLPVYLGETNSSLNNYFLSYCPNLKSATIPNGVIGIGNNFLAYSMSIKLFSIPKGVTSIGDSCLHNNYVVRKITIPDGVTTIGTHMFSNKKLIKKIIMPNSITSIGNYFAQYCNADTIELSNSLTSIGSYPFAYSNVETVNIPHGITALTQDIFYSCENLKIVVISSSVTSIGASAFGLSYRLKEVHLQPTSPPTLANTNAFPVSNCGVILYVPYSADHSVLNAYKSASNWSTYASKIIEELQS